MKKLLEEKDQQLAGKEQTIDQPKYKFDDETPTSNLNETSSRFQLKTVHKTESHETRSKPNMNISISKHLNMDVLRNKLMTTEIQREGALKMAETFRDKFIKMQDLISSMMEQKNIGAQLPPDPAKKDKFIKPHKRHALGYHLMKSSGNQSHSNSMHLDPNDSISPNTVPHRKRPKDSSEIFNTSQMSRDNSRKRKVTNITAISTSFQGKLNFPLDLPSFDDNVNLYSKELQKR